MDSGLLEVKLITRKGWRVAAVNLHGNIGSPDGFGAHQFRDSLNGLGDYDVLYATLDSAGGSVVDAWFIYDYLTTGLGSRHESLVLITGQCSGEAILIALGFGQILMRPDSYIRFRPPPLSRPEAVRQASGYIARLLAKRVGRQVDEVLGWMDKNKKFTSDECLQCSLCDGIV
jgi:ATP-dependent protease ClpP protease subunit